MKIDLWVVSLIDVATAQVLVQVVHADINAAESQVVDSFRNGSMGESFKKKSILDNGKRAFDYKEHVIDV